MTIPPARILGTSLLLLACCSGKVYAEGAKGRPIEFSAPPGERGKTDEPRLTPGQTRLGQWESELKNPFQGLTPGNSLDGAILSAPLPMPPPAVQSPRARELSDRKRDWMFLSLEEMFDIKTIEDKYKAPELTPDGRNRDELRPMARAYLDAADAAHSNAISARSIPTFGTSYDSALGSVLSGLNAGTALPSSGGPAGEELRRMLGRDSTPGSSEAHDATDFFKFNTGYKPPGRPTSSEMQRAEDFRQIYDFGSGTLPEAAGVVADQPFSSPYVDPSFFDPPKPAVAAPVATLGGAVSGNGMGAASTASSIYNPPPAEATRVRTPTPSPFMNVPRRSL